MFNVRTIELHKACLEAASARKDSWGDEVSGRLSSINDLVAEEGVYHNDCRLKFLKHYYAQPKSDTRVPQSVHVTKSNG